MLSPQRALDRLREGNRRFVSGDRREGRRDDATRRRELVAGQEPWAVVIGCADSRVPVEIVFDQGPGDLFVIRVAGNIAGPSQIGSVEYAAEVLGTRLVVVLGHSGCGAVTVAARELRGGRENASPNLRAVVDPILASLHSLPEPDDSGELDLLVSRGVRAHVRAAAERLRRDSSILQALVAEQRLRIVGAEYRLETGVVDFLQE